MNKELTVSRIHIKTLCFPVLSVFLQDTSLLPYVVLSTTAAVTYVYH